MLLSVHLFFIGSKFWSFNYTLFLNVAIHWLLNHRMIRGTFGENETQGQGWIFQMGFDSSSSPNVSISDLNVLKME